MSRRSLSKQIRRDLFQDRSSLLISQFRRLPHLRICPTADIAYSSLLRRRKRNDRLSLPPLPAMAPEQENYALAIPNAAREVAVPMYFKQLQPECTVPSQRLRVKNAQIPASSKKWSLKPLKTFSSRIIIPGEWEHKTHPNGRPYYLNRSSSRRFRFLTDANLQDSHVAGNVERFVDTIEGLAADVSERRLVGDTTEVVLELEDFSWKYYIVDHERRELVWLQKHDLTWMSEKVGGVLSEAHMQLCMEEQYWIHIERYPHQHVLPERIIDEITSMVTFSGVDSLTSGNSTFPFKSDDLEKLLLLLKTLQRSSRSDRADDASRCFTTAAIARLMATFCHHRFIHFHGQHEAGSTSRAECARQEQRLADARHRTWLIRVFSPLFFRAPDTYLRGMLDGVWVDGAVQRDAWMSFITGVQRDWEGLVLYATLLLNVNVALLVTPALALKDASGRTAQAVSQVSLATSLGSVVIGLLLARQHRNKDDSAQRAAKYLNKRTHPYLGLESLSILYSLPYALLMWGVTSLLVAIASTAFKVSGLAQSLTNATAWGCVMVLIVWTIFTSLERSSKTPGGATAAQSPRCGIVNSDEQTKEKFDDALHNFEIAEKARTKKRRLSATAAGLVRRSRDSLHLRRRRAHRTRIVE
ncbi:hypothetical protein SCHPADRAFT_370831 [Schizopora paradoxa]|uniref:WW domain-containing protein n=1 Tax=Schizopora paradoxa TaxID=27342 RepID=A0A0H2RV60_9AGAM|nr:hypothetical protein SCHPADRAFT_370831 [Schizopora paradoxa]